MQAFFSPFSSYFLLESSVTHYLGYKDPDLVFTGLLWDDFVHNICVTHKYEAYSPEKYNSHQVSQTRQLTVTDEHKKSKQARMTVTKHYHIQYLNP